LVADRIKRNDVGKMKFPTEGKLFRGGGLPEEYRDFFKPNQQFRVPGFLASSVDEVVADKFMVSAYLRGEKAVKWIITLDPKGEKQPRCPLSLPPSLTHSLTHALFHSLSHSPTHIALAESTQNRRDPEKVRIHTPPHPKII
jgi:hypothetical protein